MGLHIPVSVAAPWGEPSFPGAGLGSGEAAGPAASSTGGMVKSKYPNKELKSLKFRLQKYDNAMDANYTSNMEVINFGCAYVSL